MINRRRFIQDCGIYGSALLSSSVAAAAPYESVINHFGLERKPNIIIILADDLGYGDLSYYGNKDFETPYLDALAAGGIYFTDFHSSGAVCSPTRAGLLTGCYQQRCGIGEVLTVKNHREQGLDPRIKTFPKVLQQNGYKTALFGKWHLGYESQYNPIHYGFDRFRGYLSGNIDYISHIDQAGVHDWWHNDQQIREEGYTTHLITKHALEFIEENQDHSFLLYLAHEAPHYPYQGPNDTADRTEGGDFPAHGSRKDVKAAYRTMIKELDRSVGDIQKKLRALNLEKDTLILFFSDNGATPVGSNGDLRGHKGSLWEGGHRVPALAYYPRVIAPGRKYDLPAISLDLFPTILSVAGIDVPEEIQLDGVDLMPSMTESRSLPERTLFWEHGNQQAARQGSWKLMITKQQDKETIELFNLSKDKSEQKNIAADHSERVQSLLVELKQWDKEVHQK